MASRDETVVRALTSYQGGPGLIPTQSHMWIVMLVLALLRGFFFRYSGFLSLIRIEEPNENQAKVVVASSRNIVI